MTYRAMVDSQQKSPVKRRRMQSSADCIIQEVMRISDRERERKQYKRGIAFKTNAAIYFYCGGIHIM